MKLIIAKLEEKYGIIKLEELREAAKKNYPELEKDVAWEAWLVEYVLDAASELFEEYDVELED